MEVSACRNCACFHCGHTAICHGCSSLSSIQYGSDFYIFRISIRWHRLHVIRVLPFTTASYSLARSESCAAQGAGPGRESRGEGARRDLRYVSAGGGSRGAAVACRSFAELSTVNSAKLPDALHAPMQLQEPHSLVEYRSPRDAEVWCDEARQAAHGFAKRVSLYICPGLQWRPTEHQLGPGVRLESGCVFQLWVLCLDPGASEL